MNIPEPADGLELRHARTAPLDLVEWRDSGNGEDYTFRGHAAVFNSQSQNLGGFVEIIEPGFFRDALRRGPDVRLLIDHIAQADKVLGRTKSGTLELREDETGLANWARVARTPFSTQLRTVMERGDVDQQSFAFTINEGADDWDVRDDGHIVRTLYADGCRDLYDVSIVTFPAYTQTSASMRSCLEDAVKRGRIPGFKTLADLRKEAGWAASEIPAPAETNPVEARLSASRLALLKRDRERVLRTHS